MRNCRTPVFESLWLGICLYWLFAEYWIFFSQELNKRQQKLEQAHSMLLRHHEKTQELEYRQQKAVHQLREEQVQRQHDTELSNQHEYMERAERELRKKHALQLKQQPKSLKVIIAIFSSILLKYWCCRIFSILHYKFINILYSFSLVSSSGTRTSISLHLAPPTHHVRLMYFSVWLYVRARTHFSSYAPCTNVYFYPH